MMDDFLLTLVMMAVVVDILFGAFKLADYTDTGARAKCDEIAKNLDADAHHWNGTCELVKHNKITEF